MKTTRLRPTSTCATVTDATGAVADSLSPVSMPVSARSETTKVAMNVPSATLVDVARTNVRVTRGENCWLASWSATSVIENTTPRNVRIAVAIVARMSLAAPGLPTHQGVSDASTEMWSSRTRRRKPTTIAPTRKSVGMSQNESLTTSPRRTSRKRRFGGRIARFSMEPRQHDRTDRRTRAHATPRRLPRGTPAAKGEYR